MEVGSGWGPAPPRVLRGGGMGVGLVLGLTFSKKFVQVEGKKEEGESSLVKCPGAGIILSDRRVDHPTPPGFWGSRDFASGAYSIGTGFCGALDTGTVTPRYEYNGILYSSTREPRYCEWTFWEFTSLLPYKWTFSARNFPKYPKLLAFLITRCNCAGTVPAP